ncbi:MAG: FecR domain-containing protein [Fimbriimonas sp.]|nr:FecR domain-containing protein [Fimbriimonas sp.]
MARISYIQGGANWRPSENVDWSNASTNLPLRQGAEIWVNTGGRAEIQFDDGSRVRFGSGTIAELLTTYSDSRGEFTEIKLNVGLASMTLTNRESTFQVDTPKISIKASGTTKLRVGCDSDVEVAVRRGECQIDGYQGAATLRRGEYVDVADSNRPFRILGAPAPDIWDNYCDSRDSAFDRHASYVPSNISICAGDLDAYGVWRSDPQYGHVWYPNVAYVGWRPYHDGHWVWVDPFGWTWVGDEPWGWAPYHYGTWIHASYGWGWCPGPRYQFWSPAVVDFCTYNGAVAWCPLAPAEVFYPDVSAGLRVGSWFFSFGIGGAACYCPGTSRYFAARPWDNVYVNRYHGGFDSHRVDGLFSHRQFVNGSRFMPFYGRSAFAITRTTTAGFAGRGRFQSGTNSDRTIFARGQTMIASRGRTPVFGPSAVRPTFAAITPGRSFVSARPPSEVMQRPVFRAALPGSVARFSTPAGRTLIPSARAAAVSHSGPSSSNRSTGIRRGGGSKYSRYNGASPGQAPHRGTLRSEASSRYANANRTHRSDSAHASSNRGASPYIRSRTGSTADSSPYRRSSPGRASDANRSRSPSTGITPVRRMDGGLLDRGPLSNGIRQGRSVGSGSKQVGHPTGGQSRDGKSGSASKRRGHGG